MHKLGRFTFGGLVLIAGIIQYAIAQIIVASAWSDPPFSLRSNYISDLGNTECGSFTIRDSTSIVCSPRHMWMNASFVAIGLTTVVGTFLLWHFWPARRLTTIGLILWLLAGIGKIIVGFVPENTNLSIHSLGALNLPLSAIGVILLSICIRQQARNFGIIGLLLAAISLIGFVVFLAGQSSGSSSVGLLERVAGYPINFWTLILGVLAIRYARDGGFQGVPTEDKLIGGVQSAF